MVPKATEKCKQKRMPTHFHSKRWQWGATFPPRGALERRAISQHAETQSGACRAGPGRGPSHAWARGSPPRAPLHPTTCHTSPPPHLLLCGTSLRPKRPEYACPVVGGPPPPRLGGWRTLQVQESGPIPGRQKMARPCPLREGLVQQSSAARPGGGARGIPGLALWTRGARPLSGSGH